VIGRVIDVRSTTIRVALDVGAKGFTKVGPDGLQTVGVVNSYVMVPAGAHRIVGIVSGVYISGRQDQNGRAQLLSQDDTATYELEATVVGRFEGDVFKSGLTGYPPLHSPVHAATPQEVRRIFLPMDGPALRIGTSAVASDQAVHLDANLLLGHHCAVVGSTGSGKSCTVTAVIDGLLDHEIPNGHIVIFDINGEYAQSFAATTVRGKKTRPLVLGPKPGTSSGLFLPHWFMNNEEHLSMLRASEGVQAPVLQRSIADARIAGASTNVEMLRLQNVRSSLALVEGAFTDSKGGAETTFLQLAGLKNVVDDQVSVGGVCADQWAKIKEILDYGIPKADVPNAKWTALTPGQRDVLMKMIAATRSQMSAAFDALGMGSGRAAPDFDAPIYYSLQELCDYFLPTRIQLEQSLFGLTNNIVVFGGGKDIHFYREVSDLLGTTRISRQSISDGPGGIGTNRSVEDVPVLRPEHIRLIPERQALVVAENAPPILAKLRRCVDGRAGKALLQRLAAARTQVAVDRHAQADPAERTAAALAYAHAHGLGGHIADDPDATAVKAVGEAAVASHPHDHASNSPGDHDRPDTAPTGAPPANTTKEWFW